MNRRVKFGLLALMCALSLQSIAQSGKFTTYQLPNSKLHLFQSGDPLGDVSFIIEGEKKVVILEQPAFVEATNELNAYVEKLGKPIDKIISNYHPGGLSGYPSKKIIMASKMVEFTKSDNFNVIMKHFKSSFGDAIDVESIVKVSTFDIPSTEEFAGVKFDFYKGAASDFPAAAIKIDDSAYYIHFAPSKSHANPMQINSREAVDATLAELESIKESGVKHIFGSHGAPATMEDVEFQIEYLKTIKRFLESSSNGDIFGQKLLSTYRDIPGVENIKALSAKLYPGKGKDEVVEKIRGRMQDYFDSVSNLDMELARALWADDERVSIITPRGHFFGFESISNDFFLKAFSSFKSRKLSSLSEVINIYGDSANVQLYWKFETESADGVKSVGYGRESLIFEITDGVWRLVHVHYSR